MRLLEVPSNPVTYRLIRLDAAGPEMVCPHCREPWPLDLEHWHVDRKGYVTTSRCRSCERERGRLYQALRRHDPAFVESERTRKKGYRQWLARHEPGLVDAYDRERRQDARDYHHKRRAA